MDKWASVVKREGSLLGLAVRVALLCALFGPRVGAEQVTALFLGNSHTYFNDLPSLVQNLARSAGDTLAVDSSTPGGCTPAYPPNAHLYTALSISLIETGGWDYVVLQEQSQIPVIPYIRDNYMYSGAVVLDSMVRANTPCCHTTFFMTWGWENGGQHSFGGYTSPDFADYGEMQDSVRTSYMRIADSLSAPVAPAGVAWQNAIHDGFPLSLFNPDGYHPSLSGSYLAACVFYAVFFQKSPSDLAFTGGLSEEHAYWLQAIADSTVLLHLPEWNIDPDMPYSSFEYDWSLAQRPLDLGSHAEMIPHFDIPSSPHLMGSSRSCDPRRSLSPLASGSVASWESILPQVCIPVMRACSYANPGHRSPN